ncbi:hypothetical protein A3715_04810 [Oleiphilus sp. HI0009]|uniref:TIGR04283 family arsenosugar biosynthesis glycosyltransferase n=1 Tax=unclassified Oleiphilus TaxID=2631174 RepID=UPI0007C39F15|nr:MULTISPECIES: TIGR04283 family arsenosugar biosynthesis glycosyltransferase [unclassified Oleiphilus]KZX83424.1 hypothetical protein A3715_04810 [Oleiphilus sp. HI0009]KZY68742.1 hypothetical protein A3738_04755 [Oleiphilus sp. HI0066]KZY69828.1 hypothetical protein A3739_07760 [Oleiphilus sp. HI0067]KZY70373.1 hypothetical protein A3739_18110 [Oleiphilus sp. HI0067]
MNTSPANTRLSVVIPVHNEQDSIIRSVSSLLDNLGNNLHELVVVDAASTDDTRARFESLQLSKARYLMSDRPGRAYQMNFGAKHASGDILMFVHADTTIELFNDQQLKDFSRSDCSWGYGSLEFDNHAPHFRFLSFMIRWRSGLSSICTGDQTQVIKKSVFEALGGFPEQILMEDVEISIRLKERSKPQQFTFRSITSARKWETEGFVKTILNMWRWRFSYWIFRDADKIARQYYRDR